MQMKFGRLSYLSHRRKKYQFIFNLQDSKEVRNVEYDLLGDNFILRYYLFEVIVFFNKNVLAYLYCPNFIHFI